MLFLLRFEVMCITAALLLQITRTSSEVGTTYPHNYHILPDKFENTNSKKQLETKRLKGLTKNSNYYSDKFSDEKVP